MRYGTPRQPTSSSKEKAMWTGLARLVDRNAGTSASTTARKPFMSQAPRPYSLPSLSTMVKGSLSHAWPSTGTTSVWPDSTTPPCVAPFDAGSVAHRLACVLAGLCTRVAVTPTLAR
ncbi:hypothetical protein NESM_000940700 [Novymonas esmeraldas]|uniref:Uncharacterized protein n=1 Tax=Novymonas esmeraldas TaxID=1808958 RepID=A0AAW0F1X0_9TRYP